MVAALNYTTDLLKRPKMVERQHWLNLDHSGLKLSPIVEKDSFKMVAFINYFSLNKAKELRKISLAGDYSNL